MTRFVALLRAVNVGKARRLPMADLRALLTGLGYTDVRTLLNSGNAVFDASGVDTAVVRRTMESALADHCGFDVPVIVLTAEELEAVIDGNALMSDDDDPSRFLVAFVNAPSDLKAAEPLLDESWTPGALALAGRAAYLNCPDGVIDSKLAQAFSRALDQAATIRNWSTVLKLQAAARPAE